MQILGSLDGELACLSLRGRFDFHCQRDFRAAYQEMLDSPLVREVTVDLGDVDYLDSSALGMLLLLRERAEASGKKVALARLAGTVKEVLEIANFGMLFTIRD